MLIGSWLEDDKYMELVRIKRGYYQDTRMDYVQDERVIENDLDK